ncbi:MAG: GNAT family N-acetyltransferase [Chloroflexi bacterium]|nr:GNAT family N-acetyltransferase [Chloroflexota bacterium]
MSASLLYGDHIRLAAINAERDAEAIARWTHDSEYWRLLTSEPLRPQSQQRIKDDLEKENPKNDAYVFGIHTITDDRLIGFVALDDILWSHGHGWLGIGIGDPSARGKGYGTDAMRVILRYAFEELNLYRVSLNVFEYNQRALSVYLKVGFTEEGRMRNAIHRDGRWWDIVFFGILKPEWEINRG